MQGKHAVFRRLKGVIVTTRGLDATEQRSYL